MSENQTETNETTKKRIFVYNGQEFKDPGEIYTVEDVKKHLTAMYPEIAQCEIRTTETDTETRIEFVKRVGTKGREDLDGHPCHCAACEKSQAAPPAPRSDPLPLLDLGCGVSAYVSALRCPHCGASLKGALFVDEPRPHNRAPCPVCGRRMTIDRIAVVLYIARKADQ